MSIDPKRTPQEYEILTGGGAESAQVGRRGMDRRQLLRRSVGLSIGLVATAGSFGALVMFYPNLAGKFGSVIVLKPLSNYPAAEQAKFQLGQKGIFYEPNAKSYIMHLAEGPDTTFLLPPAPLADAISASGSRRSSCEANVESVTASRRIATSKAPCFRASTCSAECISLNRTSASGCVSMNRLTIAGILVSAADDASPTWMTARPPAPTRRAVSAACCT